MLICLFVCFAFCPIFSTFVRVNNTGHETLTAPTAIQCSGFEHSCEIRPSTRNIYRGIIGIYIVSICDSDLKYRFRAYIGRLRFLAKFQLE